MPDWDKNSPELAHNLASILEEIIDRADLRETPAVALARNWHRRMMKGLNAEPRYVGAFRGEAGLERTGVRIGRYLGAPARQVAPELNEFEQALQAMLRQLDRTLPIGEKLDAAQRNAVINASAWAHSEWVRIHPFANGNGRTARLWANFIATRYGLPPFIRLRPRPDDGYGQAGIKAMEGDWKPTAVVFRKSLGHFLNESSD